MITVLFKDCNYFSQDLYDQTIDQIQLHMMQCTCGKRGCLIRYGRYQRHVKCLSELLPLVVQRVRCKECGVSHALIPSLLIPYSQITLKEQQEILGCAVAGTSPDSVMDKNFLIDENNVKYIIRQFKKHWQQRILSLGLSLSDCLTVPCLNTYLRQFMQIHRTRNILFCATNTS